MLDPEKTQPTRESARIWGCLMGTMTNRNMHSEKIALLLIAFVALAAFQPGFAETQDIEKIRKAAGQGDAGSQFILGGKYSLGAGVSQDYRQALKWWRLAAEQGHAGAQVGLALMYRHGQGVPQDYRQALKWYRLAAEQGHAGAQVDLALMYGKGEEVPQDYQESAKWFRQAAEQGHVEAQAILGGSYLLGRGVPQSFIKAHAWMNLAAAQGDKEAVKNRNGLETLMTPAQLDRAQELAAELFKHIESSTSE